MIEIFHIGVKPYLHRTRAMQAVRATRFFYHICIFHAFLAFMKGMHCRSRGICIWCESLFHVLELLRVSRAV